jgi:hypothetical protein
MKTLFIQIQDVSEIDTSKINVFDLNKRYVDRSGNMYGLKFNRETKKVEITKIMRTNTRNESYFAQKMAIIKHSHKNGNTEAQPAGTATDMGNAADQVPSEQNPEVMMSQIFALINTFKERLSGTIKNVYNSKIFPRDQREVSIKLDDLLRDLDIDGAQRIDKLINSYREMTEYPRSQNYYIGRLDTRARTTISEIFGDDKKLKFIIFFEMHSNLKDLFFILSKRLSALMAFIEEHKKNISKISAQEKQLLSDAVTTIENTLLDIRLNANRLIDIETYIYNPHNFR